MATQCALLHDGNEGVLTRLALEGDVDAFRALFDDRRPMLRQVALRVLGNSEDAEDAVQDGLLSAYRNLRRFEGRSRFSTWLTRIVINAARQRHRRQKCRPTEPLDAPHEDAIPASERYHNTAPNPEQLYTQKELRVMISKDLDELPPLLREAFVLRDVRGLSTREAAESLGILENTLKARLWRARRQLADRLSERLVPRGRAAICDPGALA
jgi:RNA polymerase sigma-70 factor (ECF subfamily)